MNLVDRHAAFDASKNGVPFVFGKVISRLTPQKKYHLLKKTIRLGFRILTIERKDRRAIQVLLDLDRHLFWFRDDIGMSNVDCARRHRIKFR